MGLKKLSYIDNQTENLQPTKCIVENSDIEISHKMQLTMVDGKVCNTISETASTQRCYICGLTSKDFNNIDKVLDFEVIKNTMHLTYIL